MTGPLLDALVDDAGLFPPTALSMPEAVARHRADLAAAEPMLTHRFLCPAGRPAELRALLTRTDRFSLGLVADRGADGFAEACATIEADPRLTLAALELPLAAFAGDDPVAEALRAVASAPGPVPVFLEPAAPGAVDALLTAIAAHRGGRPLYAKLRCGGVRPELTPGAADVARFVTRCVAADVPFKATAGLHHAVRHRDPATGAGRHGYLNLLPATAAAASGATEDEVRAVLTTEDAQALAHRAATLDPRTAAAARRHLTSYGSCSTSTPVREASALGVHREPSRESPEEKDGSK